MPILCVEPPSSSESTKSLLDANARGISIEMDLNKAYKSFSGEVEERTPTYHMDNEAQYCLPNDFHEQFRLEIQAAYLSKMMRNHVFHAPVKKNPIRTLDIGCSTGVVTDLMSESYPQATCVGLDLSKIPQLRTHNANVCFFQGNVITQRPTQWTAEDGKSSLPQDGSLFDYVFSRLLILGMNDWPSFVKKEFNLLKPGGWAEIQDLAWEWYDFDGTIVSDGWSWLRWIRQELEDSKGMDLHCGKKAKVWMEEAGFVDVQVYRYVYPFCGSSESSVEMRDFGKFNTAAIPAMLHHAISRTMANEPSRVMDEMQAEMRGTLLPQKGRYQIFYVTIGKKPG